MLIITRQVLTPEYRAALLQKLGLPERMTANGLLEAVNILYTREEFMEMAHD